MDIEKTNSIHEARAALNQINMDIAEHPVGSPVREMLEDAAVILETVIWKLINQDLRQITDDLVRHQQKLQELSQEMEDADASLEKTTAIISKVATMLNVLLNFA